MTPAYQSRLEAVAYWAKIFCKDLDEGTNCGIVVIPETTGFKELKQALENLSPQIKFDEWGFDANGSPVQEF